MQHDPDTTDLHFALGNLFRRRGEFERAVRVHQHLLQRADLPAAERHRAQHALAQDFLKAGLFDRAEEAFRALDGTSYQAEAQLALLMLYERSRDWARAIDVAGRIEAAGGASLASRVAHYWCELAQAAEDHGDEAATDQALQRARTADPTAARPLVMAGRRLARLERKTDAMATWDELRRCRPGSFALVAAEYAQAALASGRVTAARDALLEALRTEPGIDVLRALSVLEPDGPGAARQRLLDQMRVHPTLSGALDLLADSSTALDAESIQVLRQAVAVAAKPLQRYRCAACGFEAQHWFWQCPGCLGWDSYPPRRVEEQ